MTTKYAGVYEGYTIKVQTPKDTFIFDMLEPSKRRTTVLAEPLPNGSWKLRNQFDRSELDYQFVSKVPKR